MARFKGAAIDENIQKGAPLLLPSKDLEIRPDNISSEVKSRHSTKQSALT